jgi:DNA polymerase III alpha subunit
MAHMKADLLKTNLGDRQLYYNGNTVVKPDTLYSIDLRGVAFDRIFVKKTTADIDLFNKVSDKEIRTVKEVGCASEQFNTKWNIPKIYLQMDVIREIMMRWELRELYPTQEKKQRILDEYVLFEEHDKMDLLKTLIYVVDMMTNHDQVWSGRGSSVASYILYIIGVHDVNSVDYELDIEEFFHD